jgi:hypothetical protein
MKLVIEIKSKTTTAKTKQALVSKLNNIKGTSSYRNLSGLAIQNTEVEDGNVIIHTRFQKINKKTSQKKRKDAKSEFGKRTVSTMIRTAEWTTNVYYMPLALLRQHNIVKVRVDFILGTRLTTASGKILNHRFEEIYVIKTK